MGDFGMSWYGEQLVFQMGARYAMCPRRAENNVFSIKRFYYTRRLLEENSSGPRPKKVGDKARIT